MATSDSWTQARLAHYEFAIDIQANSRRVWRALTDQVGAWWLPSFHMLGESSIVMLEPHAGGRLLESADGREILWYTVIAIDPEKTLDLAGYCTAKYGGPATTMLSLQVTSLTDRSSRLHVSDSLFGRVTDEFISSLQAGWNELFVSGLKRFVET